MMPYIRTDIALDSIDVCGNDYLRSFERYDSHGRLRRVSFVFENAFDRNRRMSGRFVRSFVMENGG